MMEIARALELNPSTCFNLVKTLESERLLGYAPDTKRYQLGLALTEFAPLVDGQGLLLRIAVDETHTLVKAIGLTCLFFQMTEQEEFLVVRKLDTRNPFKVTTSVGQRFPPNSAVLAKAYYAWSRPVEIEDMLNRHGLPPRSAHSITELANFTNELELVRHRGYSISVGEYYPDVNAVAAPIFDSVGKVSLLLAVSAARSQLRNDKLHDVGERVYWLCRRITKLAGGHYPGGEREP
jgi:DNA-binding IclR family transcriptional regulator